MKKVVPLILLCIVILGFKNDKAAYKFYNAEGKSIKYSKVVREIAKADIVFLVNYIIILFVIGYSMR